MRSKCYAYLALTLIPVLLLLMLTASFSLLAPANAQQLQLQQPITLKNMIMYQRNSSFIKEFKVPFPDRGLKGIVTDPQGNAWFYHSTYNTSTIVKLSPSTMNFTKYNIIKN